KHWRQHDLVANHEAIDVAVVSIELPAPRRICGGLAKNADPVVELAEFVGQAGQLGEMLVELHCIAGRFKSALPQAGSQNAKSEFTLLVAKLGKAEPVAHQIAMDIAPGPPRFTIDVKLHRSALVAIEGIQEGTRGIDYRLYR